MDMLCQQVLSGLKIGGGTVAGLSLMDHLGGPRGWVEDVAPPVQSVES